MAAPDLPDADVPDAGLSDADAWARDIEVQLTDDERFSLISSLMVVVFGGRRDPRVPDHVPRCAGWVPGIERLGVPELLITDAGQGVTNPGGGRPADTATAFPADVDQVPRPDLPGFGDPVGTPLVIDHVEGSDVGYRWFARTGAEPLFAFGHGLSYTTFEHSDLTVEGGDTVTASVTVANTGDRVGADVVQLYLTETPTGPRTRLLGFERVELEPSRHGR